MFLITNHKSYKILLHKKARGSAFRERCGPKDDAQRAIGIQTQKRQNWRFCGKRGVQHVHWVLDMHRAKFGVNRAHSPGAMAKCGKNGASAAKVARFTFVVVRSITLPNLVTIGLKLLKLRPLDVLGAYWPRWDSNPRPLDYRIMSILLSAGHLHTNGTSIFDQ